MALSRLDKLISASGKFSRREAKQLVREGRVTVDGATTASVEDKYEETAVVCVDGEAINCAEYRYLLMNKPGGVLSATEDRSQETVLDLLPKELQRLGLFPVGRLDKDTTGLLILTNDGAFSHSVTSPKRHVAKRYRASVDGVLDESDVAAFEAGMTLSDGYECLPARLEIVRPSVGIVTVFEGKYHQVKRMFASRGKYVTSLHRLSIGSLELPERLKLGQFAELSASDREKVYE